MMMTAYQAGLVPLPLAGVAGLLALRDAAQRFLLPAKARAVCCAVLRGRHAADARAQRVLWAAAAVAVPLQDRRGVLHASLAATDGSTEQQQPDV